MTAIDSPVSMQANVRRGTSPVDSFVERLSHPVRAQSSGPLVTLFQSLISLGMLPLVLWPARWADYLDSERNDLLDLVSWWRRRVDGRRAVELDKITGGLRPRPILMVLPWLAVAFNVFVMASLLMRGDSIGRIWDLTFEHASSMRSASLVRSLEPGSFDGMPRHLSRVDTWVSDTSPAAFPLEIPLFSVWFYGLGLAYLCQWYAVRSHAVTVRSLVRWTNKLAWENNFTQVKNEATRIGLNPLWIIIAIGFCMHNAWWAIPMVLAGSLQRRYITQSSPTLRIALANQARDGFGLVQSHGDHFCGTVHCGARLPAAAKFCPRCGKVV